MIWQSYEEYRSAGDGESVAKREKETEIKKSNIHLRGVQRFKRMRGVYIWGNTDDKLLSIEERFASPAWWITSSQKDKYKYSFPMKNQRELQNIRIKTRKNTD